jgi:hypothetical protein
MRSAIAQVHFFLNVTQQLIQKESRVILDMLDNQGNYDIHPIHYTQYFPVSLSKSREFPDY